MVLRLRWGVVNAKRAEVKIHESNGDGGTLWTPKQRISASVPYQKIQSSKWRSLKLWELAFFLTDKGTLTYSSQ